MRDKDFFDEFRLLGREMDEMFLDIYMGGPFGSSRSGVVTRPSADLCYPKDLSHVRVTFELPGIDIANIRISVFDRTLVVEGAKPRTSPKGNHYNHMEIDTGPFRRKLMLPFDVDAENSDVIYDKGLLVLELPKASDSQSQRVSIVLHSRERRDQ